MHADGAGKAALDHRDRQRLQAAQTACGQITGNAAHSQGIRAVGGNLDVDHRVIHAAIIDKPQAQRRIFGQINDAVMIV